LSSGGSVRSRLVGTTAEMSEAMAEQMVRIVRDPLLRQSLAEGARVTAEERSWARELDRLEKSYREIVARAASSRVLAPIRVPA
jgi:glycosyltransferase involved in cell wall biosynthesis